MNGSGVKEVGIDIGSTLDLYIFMGVLFLVCACELKMAGDILIWRRQWWIL